MKLTTYLRLIRDQARKNESRLFARSQGCNNLQLFHLGILTRNYYTPDMLSCNIGNYLIKRQSERYIIIANIFLVSSLQNMKNSESISHIALGTVR